MRKGWSDVALGELIEKAEDSFSVKSDQTYPNLGIYGQGRGSFTKPSISGAATSAQTLYRVRAGQFIYSRLFAFEGAYALVQATHDGFFVSNEFPTFDVDLRRLLPGYLFAYFRRPTVWHALASQSTGLGDRRQRVHPDAILAHRIPLASLAEQQRLVAHLDAIQSRLTRAQELREEEQKEKLALVTSLAHRWDLDAESKRERGWQKVGLGAVLEQTSETAAVDSTASYPNIGIYSYGRGTFNKPPIEGANTSATQLFRVRAGQFIYSRLFAFEGAYALVRPSQDDHYVSNEFPSFNLDTQRILPEFLFAYFKSPAVWTELAEQSTGLGNRRQRIHPEVIRAHGIDLPPIEYQAKVRDAFMKLERAGASAGEEEMDALIPSLLDRIFNS